MLRINEGGNAYQACAACKHQRRKCTQECPLAPYFPAEKSSIFLAVQKVFGVSNIVKMIRELNSHEKRQSAVDSLCWEAQWRLIEPIEGCYGEFKRTAAELGSYKKVFDRHDCDVMAHGIAGKPEILNAVNNFNGVLTASNTNNSIINNGGLIGVLELNQPFVYGFNKGNCGTGKLLYQPATEDADQQLFFRAAGHYGKKQWGQAATQNMMFLQQ